MENSEKELNPEQLSAVKQDEGPVLVIAGAGTGKTTVIVEKIKRLISLGLARPEEILALTFTDKAASEMEERVDIALPYGYTDMWISTFHSFCDRVLRQEAIQIGLDPGYKLITQSETIQFLTNNLFKFNLKYFRPLGNPTKFVDGMIQHFSRLKDEDASPDDYLKFAKQQQKIAKDSGQKETAEKNIELADAYQVYEKLKIKQGLLDFSDLIANVLKLFRIRKAVLGQYQKKFKYILVDEFQDTNFAQYALLQLLAPPEGKPDLTVVGDDSQSVYKFRGAAVSNILQFMEDYKGATQIVLKDNYRSAQTILDHAYRLIKNNDPDTLEAKLGISKNLLAVRKIKESPVQFLYRQRAEDEAEAVASAIKNLKLKTPTFAKASSSAKATEDKSAGKKNYDWSDIAILVRANNHADAFIRALARNGIPYQFLGPGQLFRQPEIKNLIAYLKVLYDFEDSTSLYRVLALEHFDIPARDLAAINSFGRRNNLSLFEACERVEEIFVSSPTKEKIKKFVEMVSRHLKLLPKETAGQIVYYFLQDSGLLRKLTEYKSAAEEKQAQNISKFFDRLKTYEADHEDASVQTVVDWINLSMSLGESPLASSMDWTEENRVSLLTVHSAKGLEFPVVFLVNLVSSRFPTRERKEQIPIPDALIKEILPAGDYHEQEERRLFYVGMTRAEDQLFLTAAGYYGEGKRKARISPFVYEALGKKELGDQLPVAESQLSIFDFKPAEKPATSDARQITPINYLSFSQINTFDTCPLQYRYKYVQRIPTLPSSAQSFGDSIHKALKDFYQGIKRGEKLAEKDLIKFMNHNWSSQGYASKAHEQKTKKEGERMLKDFYKKIDSRIVPLAIEQSFMIKLTPELKIGGKIDRVDETEDGLEIIDYKTGKIVEQKEVDESLQMTVYALAAQDKGIYGVDPGKITMTFYFLDKGEKRSTKRTAKDLEKARGELIKKADLISKSKFDSKPGPWCDFCDYRMVCDAWS